MEIKEVKSFLNNIKGYEIECDPESATKLIHLLVANGWKKIDSSSIFSPITSFWQVKLQKRRTILTFDSDNYICQFYMPDTIYSEYANFINSMD